MTGVTRVGQLLGKHPLALSWVTTHNVTYLVLKSNLFSDVMMTDVSVEVLRERTCM